MRVSPAGRARRPLVVLHTACDQRDRGNPYTLMLMESMPASVVALDFTWARAIVGRYDVLHLHWPELLLRDPQRLRQGVKRILFGLMYLRLVLARTPIVQTVHNLAPHESASRYERWVLAALGRRTRSWVTLNPAEVDIPAGRKVEILHGHYRDWFAEHDKPDTDPGRYLFFGLIRPYKQVVSLMNAFAELNDPDTSLRIVGSVSDPAAEERAAALAHEPNVSVEFAFVPDARLAHELGLAELVVLPYREFYNSGAALLALSLGRPVLTPRSAASQALQEEFGTDWVMLYDGQLCGAHLKDSLVALRERGATSAIPDLSRREWTTIAAAHAELYAQVAR